VRTAHSRSAIILALPKLPDLPQPEAPVVPRAEQYQADAGETAAANVAAATIAAKSDFIVCPSITPRSCQGIIHKDTFFRKRLFPIADQDTRLADV
jgi:hypothetical protein